MIRSFATANVLLASWNEPKYSKVKLGNIYSCEWLTPANHRGTPQTDASQLVMTLDRLIDKLKDINGKLFDRFGHLYYASLAYLSIKVLDITSTSLYLHEQNNLNAEANDLTRHLMEQFGINAGLMIKNVPMAAIILGGAYLLNKFGPGLNRHLGSILVYLISLLTVQIVINNFAVYFGVYGRK